MIIKVVRAMDWCLNKYVDGFQPKVLNKVINLTGELSSGTGNLLNLRALEQLGEQLESFNFKEEVIDKTKTDTLGPTGASVVRFYILSCIPLFIKVANQTKKLRLKGLEEEVILKEIENEFGLELKIMEEKIDELTVKLQY
ncbi:hypothetical protein [Sporosarcina psychrophila]|uniref:hypothetical protein n=1 Tax=Sporosarcina psychrophila TaxID=1476 RepID=UPI00078EF2F9|nr:hypothetical protein [Sporosarcina psychrophila]AMQ06722.1 hypothetical protein AZE41_12705 [Sporosarcina psychrophila]